MFYLDEKPSEFNLWMKNNSSVRMKILVDILCAVNNLMDENPGGFNLWMNNYSSIAWKYKYNILCAVNDWMHVDNKEYNI